MRTAQWLHQEREFEEHRDDPARALLWQMRTGKSKHTLDVDCHWALEHGVTGVLNVAPNGVHRQWVRREIPQHWWPEVPVVAHAWDSMAAHRSREDEALHEESLERCLRTKDVAFLSVNCEALINPRVQKAIQRLFKGRRVALTGDELHRFRTPGSKRSRIMRGFRKHAVMVRGLTGTIIRNSPLAAWAEFEVIQHGALGYDTYGDFKQSFALYTSVTTRGGRTFPQLTGYQNLERLTELMAPWSSVVLRRDCLAGDTPIMTREHGVVPIASVAGQIVTLLDGNGDWVECPIADHGLKQTCETVLRAGRGKDCVRVRSTYGHGWQRADGRQVLTAWLKGIKPSRDGKNHGPPGTRIASLAPLKQVRDEDMHRHGVVHGMVYGDGHRKANGQYGMDVFSDYDDFEAWLCQFHSHEVPYKTAIGSGTGIHYHIPREYSDVDLKSLPNPTTVHPNYLLGFLRGWLAADGSVGKRHGTSLACGGEELAWLRRWAPLAGFLPLSHTWLPDETNLGVRNKRLCVLTLKSSFVCPEDMLLARQRARINAKAPEWTVVETGLDPRTERVYCPVVPTTHSFALGSLVHSLNCEDLPAVMPVRRIVEMSEESTRAFTQMRKELIADIRSGVVIEAAEGGKRAIKLQQAQSGFMIDDKGQVHDLGARESNPRIKAMIEEVNGTEGKVVIWCQFREDLKRVHEALELEGIGHVEYHGGVGGRDRDANEDAFREDPRIKAFVGQVQAGGEGLDLSANGSTDAILWYSHTQDGIKYDQGLERATKMGGKSIAVINFENPCPGSRDTAILLNHEAASERSDRYGGSGLQALLRELETQA